MYLSDRSQIWKIVDASKVLLIWFLAEKNIHNGIFQYYIELQVLNIVSIITQFIIHTGFNT